MFTEKATWSPLLSELIQEFERISNGSDESWRPVLTEYLQLISQDKESSEIWPQLQEFIHKNIDILSGYQWNFRPHFFSKDIYRRNGQYFMKEGEEEVMVHGAKTALEERVDYISNSITVERGLLHSSLKVFALTNIERLTHYKPDVFPTSVNIVLGESNHYTHFLCWDWAVKWPYQMRPLKWRPDDNYCDSNWLAADLVTYISEKENLIVDTDILKPDPSLAEKWGETFGKAQQMYSFSLETDLQIGEGIEAWIDFRGHKYRWVNGNNSSYPVLISSYADGKNDKDVELRSFKFISHLSFVFEKRIEIDGWVGTINRFNPATSNPRRRNFFEVVPEGYFREVQGTNQERLDFALSLYREGVSSSSPFYKFLNFYKIIQFAFGEKSGPITSWIEKTALQLPSYNDVYFQKDFVSFNGTVTDYLYEAGRNAIAHVNLGSGKEVIDPDNITHLRRINTAIHLIHDLARKAIESGLF